MQKNQAHLAVRRICLCALLCAMSVLLGYIAKMIFGTSPLRLTFENLPVVFAGIAYGPVYGALVGAVADLSNCLFAGQAPVALITVGAAAVGLFSGLLARFVLRRRTLLSLLAIELITQLSASVIIKSVALHIYFSYPYIVLLPRLPIYIGIALAEGYCLYVLFKHPAIGRYISSKEGHDEHDDL